LQDMFARLTAAHLDPDCQAKVHPSFARVLGQLSPLDAQILMLIDTKEFKNWETDSQKPMHQRVRWSAETVIKLAKEDLGNIDAGQVRLSLENLERLGICVDETLAYELGNYVDSSPGLV